MYKNKKDSIIVPITTTGWEIVDMSCIDKECIIAYIGGVIPIKVKGSGLTQEEFDKLYPAI